MKPARLLISVCYSVCPKCKLPTEIKMFESGAGGDFATYIGVKTGAVYRVDLGKIHYQGMSLETLLSPAQIKEEKLIQIPNEIKCKICGNVFHGTSVRVEGEEVIDAFEL